MNKFAHAHNRDTFAAQMLLYINFCTLLAITGYALFPNAKELNCDGNYLDTYLSCIVSCLLLAK